MGSDTHAEVLAAVRKCGQMILDGRAALQVKVGGFRLDSDAANARMEENSRQATRDAISKIAEAQKRLFDLALDLAKQPASAATEAEEKAALWDGLLGAARLRALGWAGDIDNEADPVTHFGMEFWTRYPGYDFTESNARARQLLTAFACAALVAKVQAEAGRG